MPVFTPYVVAATVLVNWRDFRLGLLRAPKVRFATGLTAGGSGIRTISPSSEGMNGYGGTVETFCRCTRDGNFRVLVKECGLALLSPCGPSLFLGVELALDASFLAYPA